MTHKGPGQTKLTRKAAQAIAALLEHPTIADAAKACGVSERSLWRLLQRDDFQQRYREAQRAVVDGAIAELQGATKEAVKTLRKNLNAENPFASNAAAIAILTQSMKAIEVQELQQRITRLEQSFEEKGRSQKWG